jgi:signal recognition particle GTPase
MKFFENLKLSNLFTKKKIDENILNKFEELLIESDVGTQIALDLK